MTTNKSITQGGETLVQSTEPTGLKRRGFLGTISAGALAVGFSMLKPLAAAAEKSSEFYSPEDPDIWFNQIKGKHRIVFDVKETFANPVLPFVWPRVFLMTNSATGTPEKDCGVVMVLRHEAIPYAMGSNLWEKYKLGEVFKINNAETKSPQTKNPFWKPAPGAFKAPGIGEVSIGINELQDSGVMFCVCNAAITVFSAVVAGEMNMPADEVYKEWIAGVLPGIQVVPSGVWAVGRAQEHSCTYCG
jgi:intracellular sulfur oxidation DsrE/DsrF family protein